METLPATIITSACLGEARNTSAPNRLRSKREAADAIISMAQHAKPNESGQTLLRRPQFTRSSSFASTTGDPLPTPNAGVGVAESCAVISVIVFAIILSFYPLMQGFATFFTKYETEDGLLKVSFFRQNPNTSHLKANHGNHQTKDGSTGNSHHNPIG